MSLGGGDTRRFDVIDFNGGLVGSSNPICDVLVKDLSTDARGVIVTKAAIESFEWGVRVVDWGGPHETVGFVGVVGEWRRRGAIWDGMGFERWAGV